MWRNISELNKISESIAGWSGSDNFKETPYYIRYNENAGDERASIEYSIGRQPKPTYPDEIFNTSSGRIGLHDKGEFGGYLSIGDNYICKGNFSRIFEYNGEKYVIDKLSHMGIRRFRLIKVNDDGSIDVVYNADEFADKYDDEGNYDFSCEVGFDEMYIGEDTDKSKVVYILCSGDIINLKEDGEGRYTDVSYLLIYDSCKKENPIVRIDLPKDKVDFDCVNSIWSDGFMLFIGCDKEVVEVYLPDMSVTYLTELEQGDVDKILAEKRNWGV